MISLNMTYFNCFLPYVKNMKKNCDFIQPPEVRSWNIIMYQMQRILKVKSISIDRDVCISLTKMIFLSLNTSGKKLFLHLFWDD